MRGVARTFGVMAVALLGLVLAFGLEGTLNLATEAQGAPFWTQLPPGQSLAVQAPDFADLAARLNPAVVNISTTQAIREPRRRSQPLPFPSPFGERDPFEQFFRQFFGNLPQREWRRHSLGSGFIITQDGYIVTNNHVIEHGTDIKVAFSDQEELTAKVIGRDPKMDVALIKVEAGKELPVVPLGDSDQERVGNWVLAIGNPFGLGHTVTAGIISARGRVIGAGPYDDFLQTDASINPGNSGGPLFNMRGEVIGINTAIVASGQGIGFAIPINLAKDVLSQLRETGMVTRGWLGVQVQRVTPELAQSFGLEHARGALVADIISHSPAEQAGIQRGDVIVNLNGHTIEQMNDLPRLVANIPPGTEVTVQLVRHGQEQTVHLKVGELKEKQMASEESAAPEQELGLAVQNLSPEMAQSLGVPPQTQGVVVTKVQEGSPADDVGIQQGDVIEEVNQHTITDEREYRAALRQMKAHEPILLLVRRGHTTLYLAMQLEH
jgi:serine protease Do